MASNWKVTDGPIGIELDDRTAGTSTDGAGAPFKLGSSVTATDGSEWVFVQADGAIAVNNCVCITAGFQAANSTDANVKAGQRVAVCTYAFADNEFGWVMLMGTGASVNVASAASAGTPVYHSTTAGRLWTTTSFGSTTLCARISGIILVSSGSSDSVTAVNAIVATHPHYAPT